MVIRSVYLRAFSGTPYVVRSIELSNILVYDSSILSRGELSKKERSNWLYCVSIRGDKGVVLSIFGSLLSTYIGYKGTRSAPLYPIRIFLDIKAFSCARTYISVYYTRAMRLGSLRERVSVLYANARLSGAKIAILSG